MMCMGTKLVVAIFFSLFRPSRGSVDEIAAIKHPLAPARSTWSLRCANACRHHKNNARCANYFLSNHFNFTVFLLASANRHISGIVLHERKAGSRKAH